MSARLPALAAATALALSGCGGSSGAPHAGTSATPGTGTSELAPPPSAHPATPAMSPDAICQVFAYRLTIGPLRKPLHQLDPGDGPALYAELEGLSRRLEFAPITPARRTELRQLAAAYDRAAATGRALGHTTSPSAAAQPIARLGAQLAAANALATALSLPHCRIALQR